MQAFQFSHLSRHFSPKFLYLSFLFAVCGAPGKTEAQCNFQDTYPYPTEGKDLVDPWTFYFRQCTSYVAWKVNETAGTTKGTPFFTDYYGGVRWSDASNWVAAAQLVGVKVDNKPAPGAVAYWGANEQNSGAKGHVAFVESVNTDGTVNVSEYNFSNPLAFGVRCNKQASKYIHVIDRSASQPTSLPIISTVSVVPTEAQPGSVIVFEASVIASAAQTVLLGATLYPTGQITPEIKDSTHDKTESLTSGTNTVTRSFTLASGTAPGVYDAQFTLYRDTNGNGIIDTADIVLVSAKSAKALTIAQPTGVSITNTGLPQATAGAPYSYTFQASGGTAPYSWSAIGLPGNMNISASGTLTGTPSTRSTSTLNVRVTDQKGATGEKAFTLTVEDSPINLTIITDSLPQAAVGVFYQSRLTALGGSPAYIWKIATGTLPSGLELAQDGAILGTPKIAGTYSFRIQAQDAKKAMVTKDMNLVVTPIPTRMITVDGPLLFSSVTLGSSDSKPLIIRNDGNSAVTITGINYPPGFSGLWSGTIAPGSTQAAIVTFAPTIVQMYLGTITFNSDADRADQVSLFGIGAAPQLAISRDGNFVVLTWPGAASLTLEEAVNITGTWQAVGTVTSPWKVSASDQVHFYRVRK